jgi:hypothetical protein
MPRANRPALPAALAALVLGLQPGPATLLAANPVTETPAPPPFPTFQAVLVQVLAQPDVQQAWTMLVVRKAQGDAAGVDWVWVEQDSHEADQALVRFLDSEDQYMHLCLAKLLELRQHWIAQGHPEAASTSYMWHLANLVGANLRHRVDSLLSGPS